MRTLHVTLGLVAVLAVTTAPATATSVEPPPVALELLGTTSLQTGTQFEGTEVGGLSGIDHDAATDTWTVLSDDRSDIDPARVYTLDIDVADGDLVTGDVHITGVTTLRDADGATYPTGALDPEGVALDDDGTMLVSSEGDASQLVAPFVNRYSADGHLLEELTLPAGYAPTADGSTGVRANLALESLTMAAAGRRVVTATENALAQDGPASTLSTGSPSRILVLNERSGRPLAEYRYDVAPIPDAPVPPDAFATNGLVELLDLGDGHLLAMERAFSVGVGNTVRLYRISPDDSQRLRGDDDVSRIQPVAKHLVADIRADFGIVPDNLEGMTLGPRLPDGRQSLVLVADNNFSTAQATQFIAFAVS